MKTKRTLKTSKGQTQTVSTLDIEICMMHSLNIRQNLIVPNVSWGQDVGGKSLHECDLLMLNKTGYATEVEIKISKADLLKDKEKRHGHLHDGIKFFYYAVPEKLKDIALESIPSRAGLYVIKRYGTRDVPITVRNAKANSRALKWTLKERMKLARLGTMRILGLKIKARDWKNKAK